MLLESTLHGVTDVEDSGLGDKIEKQKQHELQRQTDLDLQPQPITLLLRDFWFSDDPFELQLLNLSNKHDDVPERVALRTKLKGK